MSAPYRGGCLCGAIRYRVVDEPLTVYACHCTDCQRHSGASFTLTILVLRKAIELECGAPSDFSAVLTDGRTRNGKFCAKCATRLWGEPQRIAQLASLRAGTLDDTSWIKPVGHIWTRSAQTWLSLPQSTPQYAEQPQDMNVLVAAWRDRQRQDP